MTALGRRSILACGAAVVMAVPAITSTAPAEPDAKLVRVCHEFAEAEYRNRWRYITSPADLADAQDTDPDWLTP